MNTRGWTSIDEESNPSSADLARIDILVREWNQLNWQVEEEYLIRSARNEMGEDTYYPCSADCDETTDNCLNCFWSEYRHSHYGLCPTRQDDPDGWTGWKPAPNRGGTCSHDLAAYAQRDFEREKLRKQVEWIEEELESLGVRIMRPYEHWNEDERYMQYMESDRYGSEW